MFSLEHITLENFRAYKGVHKFKFPTENGIYFFTGKNLAEPSLGSNGSGKSTFLDAITWCLYGLTTRKLKASEVLPWDSDVTCSVTLELTVGQQDLQIKRTQKPNSLLLNGKPVDQTELETHIRLNFDSFLYSVINTQFGQSFFSLTPSAKLTLFSDIMGLDYWLGKSEEADCRVTGYNVQAHALEKAIAQATTLKETYKEDLESYHKASATFTENKKVRIALKTNELSRVVDKAISLDEKLADIKHENRSKIKNLELLRDDYLCSIQKTSRERSECIGKTKAYEERYAEFEGLKNDCPVCLQTIDKWHLNSLKHDLKRKIETLKYGLNAIDDDHKMYMQFLIRTNGKIDALTNEVNEIRDSEAEIKLLDAKIARLEDEIDSLTDEENPWAATITQKSIQLDKVEASLAINNKTFETCQAELAAAQFWVKGFKRVRLFIIEQAFRTLEIEINNSLAQLGMTDWQISLDVERENKSGGITKGFVVFVKSPGNAEPVKWENWSGGETQRLQLAGDLGLANLICHQHGLDNTIEMFDEPSTHLSPEGMLDLADMLYERAISESKRIWIVDHAAITNFGEFQGTILARKDSNGSSISLDNP
jgi:DNA repair exonuclease SbcCD ATPase subunit